jgi:hypothetical protein
MISSPYFPGSTITLSAQFTSPGTGDLVDPATVAGVVAAPDGTLTTLVVIKDTVGQYHAIFTASVSGTHTQRWVGTGTHSQVAESEFVVLPTGIPAA